MANDYPINDPNEKPSEKPIEKKEERGSRPDNSHSLPLNKNDETNERRTPQAQGPAPTEPLGTAEPSSDDSNDTHESHRGARGTAAMDPGTRREVARKGGLAVSRNREHMAEIGRKGGQSVSRNREHMARIGRKGGTASRGSGS